MMKRNLLTILFLLFAISLSTMVEAAPMIELTVDRDHVYVGKSVANDSQVCWIQERDGRHHEIEISDVTRFRKVSKTFRPFSNLEIRSRLKKELGSDFEVVALGKYIVCAKQGTAMAYAKVFDDTYRSFDSYFSVRGFRLPSPDCPLVAIVFPDKKSFVQYAMKENVKAAGGLMGYYLPKSNRIALFKSEQQNPKQQKSNPLPSLSSIDEKLKKTMIHEATHQIAFNRGLHHRIGETPRWVVEGLAMVFESPGVRTYSRNETSLQRVNMSQFTHFGEYRQSRRSKNSIEKFLSDEKQFSLSTLDAYSEAWALSFFLIETRPSQYTKYLKTIARRNPTSQYSAKDRIRDFKAAFGSNLQIIEADFLRFQKSMK